jgi:pimeloyl-ACP methyl ester carboxylesterase
MYSQMALARNVATDDLVGEDGAPIERGFQNWKWVLALSRRLNRIGPIADWSIDTFTRDVWVYLRYNKVQQPIHEIVDRDIPKDDPCIVVSHSLGTVVAYNVLLEREERDNVRAWITLGSPLGIEAIYRRLPTRVPPIARKSPLGVGSWYNARDPEDIVALHEIPGARFAGDPSVDNSSHVMNGTSNQHGISGYLSDAKVASAIAKAAR